jgi:lipoprotein signal peptidase
MIGWGVSVAVLAAFYWFLHLSNEMFIIILLVIIGNMVANISDRLPHPEPLLSAKEIFKRVRRWGR